MAARVLQVLLIGGAVATGGMLLTGCGEPLPSPSPSLPAGVAARVAGEDVRVADLNALAATLERRYASDPDLRVDNAMDRRNVRRVAMEELLTRAVIRAEATKCGDPCAVSDRDVRARDAQLLRSLYGGDAVAMQRALGDAPTRRAQIELTLLRERLQAHRFPARPVSRAAARRVYQQQPERFRDPGGTVISEIVVEDPTEAKRLSDTLTPASFAATARRVSLDPQAKNTGGVRGAIKELPANLAAPARALQNNEISAPVRTPLGWHVLWREDRAARTVPFEEVAQAVMQGEGAYRSTQRFTSWLMQQVQAYAARTQYRSPALDPTRWETPRAPALPPSKTQAPPPAPAPKPMPGKPTDGRSTLEGESPNGP